ncbi:MAG: hypothetical protein ABIL09_11650 [Gemmatimonadota bacterium]
MWLAALRGGRTVDTLLDIVLAPQVIGMGLVVVSLLMAGRFIIQFSGEATELRARLLSIDSRLEKLRGEIPEKRQRVETLAGTVKTMQPQEQRLRQYYDTLMEIKIKVEREEAAAEEQERIKHERDRARRDLGL